MSGSHLPRPISVNTDISYTLSKQTACGARRPLYNFAFDALEKPALGQAYLVVWLTTLLLAHMSVTAWLIRYLAEEIV